MQSSAGTDASSRSKPHIAIIGAGIGGLALAIGLHRRGVAFTIYEAATQFSALGLGIAFGPNAVRAIEMISPEFKQGYDAIATGHKTPGKEHVFCDVWMAEEGLGVKKGWKGASVGGEGYKKSGSHRRALLEVMKALVPESSVKFGKYAVDMEQVKDKVHVTFEDGDRIVADAVFGCDGIKGNTRKFVLGDEFPDDVVAKYSGRYVYRALMSMDMARDALGDLAGDGIIFIGRECYLAVVPISHGTELNMLAGRVDHEDWTHKEWTHEVSKEYMLDGFRDRCDVRLLKVLELAQPVKWGLHHHPNTPTYVKGNICLLGDAAHASTPHQGSGAGQCLEDALMLSHLLSLVTDASQLPKALSIYDSILRPRGQEIVRTSDEAGLLYTLLHPACGEDVGKIVENANARFDWIWNHDLVNDLQKAEAEFNATFSPRENAYRL